MTSDRSLDILGMMRLVRRHALWAVAVAIVVLAAAAYHLSTDQGVYTASAQVLLATGSSGLPDTPASQMDVLQGDALQARIPSPPGAGESVSFHPVGTSSVLEISASALTADRAAAIANSYASVYVDEQARRVAADREEEIALLERRVQRIDERLATFTVVVPGSDAAVTSSTLRTERSNVLSKIAEVRNEHDSQDDHAIVLRKAVAPLAPLKSDPATTLLFAIPAALAAGVGVALLRSALDLRIRDVDDLEVVIGDLPVLAVVPRVRRSLPAFVAMASQKTPVAEAFRTLRTNLQFVGVDRAAKVLLVTSTESGEGKSAVASNLASSLALGGARVVFLDADLRASALPIDAPTGLSSVLADRATFESVVRRSSSMAGLDVVPAGAVPPNPSELLGSARMRQLLERLGEAYDYVVVDAPPMLAVADPLILAGFVDGVVVVARAGHTHTKRLRRALHMLHRVRASVLGVVANGSHDVGAGTYYTYGERHRHWWQRSRTVPSLTHPAVTGARSETVVIRTPSPVSSESRATVGSS